MSIKKRNRNWFFQAPKGSEFRKLRSGNMPDEELFRNLVRSVLLFNEASDTAKTDSAGHVKVATPLEVENKTNERDNFTLVVTPSNMPYVSLNTSGEVLEDTEANGINLIKYRDANGTIKYVVNISYNDDYFKIGDNKITLSNDFVSFLNEIEGLINESSGEIEIPLDKIKDFEGDGLKRAGEEVTLDFNDNIFEIQNEKLSVKNGGISKSKLEQLEAGQIIVGGIGGGNVIKSLLGEGKILIGTAIGVEVVNINNLIGAISIDDNQIKARKIDPSSLGDGLKKDMASSDASKLHIDIDQDFSLMLSSGKLRLKGDLSSTEQMRVYGYNLNGAKGFFDISNVPRMFNIEEELGTAETEIDIDISDVIPADTYIEAINLQVSIYEESGAEPDTYDQIAILPEISLDEGKVESIKFEGLNDNTTYKINIIGVLNKDL